MSNFTALGAMVALWIANAFLTVSLDKWVRDLDESIVTGVIRGAQVSVKHRRRILQVSFVTTVAAYVAVEGALALGWMLIGRNAGVEELELLAYLFAFLNAMAAFSWPLTFAFHYRHLAGVLREAEEG